MFLGNKKDEDEEKKSDEESSLEDDKMALLADINSQLKDEPKVRITGIYGDINEERCSETLYSLYLLNNSKTEITFTANEETGEVEQVETVLPIDFYVSTYSLRGKSNVCWSFVVGCRHERREEDRRQLSYHDTWCCFWPAGISGRY